MRLLLAEREFRLPSDPRPLRHGSEPGGTGEDQPGPVDEHPAVLGEAEAVAIAAARADLLSVLYGRDGWLIAD